MTGTKRPVEGDLAAAEPFEHPALFYRGEQEYLAGAVPFILEGLEARSPVAVAVPTANLDLLRSALGERTAQVRWLDMCQVGRNPGRIIPGVLRAFADAHPGERARIIGEPIWAGRSAIEYPACAQHEALINPAFAGREISILCPYDADGLDPAVLEDAAVTHPVVIDASGERRSGRYAPESIVRRCNEPLPEPSGVISLPFAEENLLEVRRFAVQTAERAGLPEGRVLDVELVVNELAANSIVHGGGSGVLRVWTEHEHVVCEVRDAGCIADPLAGRRPVPPDTFAGGRGILLVNHLADLVRVHTGPGGTATRGYFSL